MKLTQLHKTPKTATLTAVALASALALSACGGGGSTTTESEAAPAAQQATTAAGDQSAATDDAAGASSDDSAAASTGDSTSGSGSSDSKATTVKVGKSMTDKATGDVITIVSAVRHNPTQYYEASNSPNGEMVYLKVKVVPGKKFGGTISASSFYLAGDGEKSNYAASAKKEVTAAGYEYFDYASRRKGTHEGYVPIFVPRTADTLEGSYTRRAAKVIGKDQTLAEFTGTFTVPAS